MQNGAETDVDCGGVCDPCRLGQGCYQSSDCADGVCTNGACSAAGQIGFAAPVHIDQSTSGGTLAVDLDQDGTLELVISDLGLDRFQVFHGPGDGTFPELGTPAVNGRPFLFGAADLTGDGHLDLLLPTGRDAIDILPGHGDLTFGPPIVFSAPGSSDYAALGDFDGDGALDAAVSDEPTAQLQIFFGDGKGALSPGPVTSTPHPIFWIAQGDLNGDGRLDLVGCDNALTMVLLGHGDGSFTATSFPSDLLILQLIDLNGDGKLDLVGALDALEVRLGNGDGTFAPLATYPLHSGGVMATAADFDGDGIPDAAVSEGGFGTLDVLRGDGKGGFGPPAAFPAMAAMFLYTADLNRDHRIDLIAENEATSYVLLNTSK